MGSGVEGLANPCSSEAGSDRLRFAKRTKMRGCYHFCIVWVLQIALAGKCFTDKYDTLSIESTEHAVLWHSKCSIEKP